MGLTFFLSRQARRADRLNDPQPVIDSNSLREAALQASWHRDHRVARRRAAWRWVIFWGWKYGRKAGVFIMPIAIAAYLALQFWPGTFKPQSAKWQTTAAPNPPASVMIAPPVVATSAQPSEAPISIRLIPTIALRTGAPDQIASPVDLTPQSPSQPLRLTPEIQTSPKESSP